MGKSVIAEESVSDYVASLYGARKWQIGLIIGQLTAQRDYIVHLVRTPEQTNEEQNEEKRLKSIDDVDDNWAIEHAHQVSRMLTGGLEVLGVFVFGPPDMLTKAQGKLRQLVYMIYKKTSIKVDAFFHAQEAISSRVILQICSQTKKMTCKTLDASDPKATVQPAELKYQAFTSKWTTLRTQIFIDTKFLIPAKLGKATLHTQLVESLSTTLHGISNGICTIDGKILPMEQQLVISEKQGKASHHATNKSDEPLAVEIFVEMSSWGSCPKPVASETVGCMYMRGNIQCRAYVNQKSSCGEALQALKRDAVRSMLSRCEVLCEDILDAQQQENKASLDGTWACPKRVFTPLKGPVCVCDYMFQDETTQDSFDRLSELMDVTPDIEDIEISEIIPGVAQVEEISRKFSAERDRLTSSGKNQSEESSSSKSSFTVIGLLVGAVSALVAAGAALFLGDQN
ncbi:protein odr-4 homolog [Nematostella vectensis]|uniref:protein odr-4 homolog n=1 Tax=Nematostella vectensis TaxID=45351 RepID=UPI002076FAD7|nr:protein odr-4 homolog [Nematostella vectensis]